MKKIVLLILIFSAICFSQVRDPQNFERAFTQIEMSFNRAEPGNIWYLMSSPTTIRINDSLYQDISEIQLESLLNNFFDKADSVKFSFQGKFWGINTAEGHGIMSYTSGGQRDTVNVDIYLNTYRGEILISAINISKYLPESAFFNFHRKDETDTKKK